MIKIEKNFDLKLGDKERIILEINFMGKFNLKDKKDFGEVKVKAETFYKSVGEIHCPYFGELIAFNAKGLEHLKFKSRQRARALDDQYARFKLLRLAPEVLKKSHTLQGVWKTKRFETQKTNSRWEHIMKDVIFYEFIAVMENVRLKVIVKEMSGGEKHFWSVIPYWKIDAANSRRILHTGNLEDA
ncbi:MAG: hypothetical protein WC673_03050 [Candidatus Paceibacterota bacterium]|jgi:hypothetical protein